MRVSKDEAAESLAAIGRSQAALRQAFRAYRGHYYLWLWGMVWLAMGLSAHFAGAAGVKAFPWFALAGALGSAGIGLWQSSEVRMPVDRRFLAVLGAVLAFGFLWPLVLRTAPSHESMFAYIGLVVAQAYIVAGLWFDTYLLRMGIVLGLVVLSGLWWFMPYFWLWSAVGGGAALIVGGCIVRWTGR